MTLATILNNTPAALGLFAGLLIVFVLLVLEKDDDDDDFQSVG